MNREIVLYIKPETDHNSVTIPALLIFEVNEEKADQYLKDLDNPYITNDTLRFSELDKVEAFLRTCAAMLCDTFAPNDLLQLDRVIKVFQEGYSCFSIDGSQGIKLIRFSKPKTPPIQFYAKTDFLLNRFYRISHPDVTLVFSVATYLPEKLKEIQKACSRFFYWNSLINHVQGNALTACLLVISKEILNQYASMNVPSIIKEMKLNTTLGLDLSGLSGIELIAFNSKKYFSPKTSPSVFKMKLDEVLAGNEELS